MERRLGATLQRMELAELVQADAEATPSLVPTSSSNSLLVGEEWRQRNGSVQWRRRRWGEEEEEGWSGLNGLSDEPVSPLEAMGGADGQGPVSPIEGSAASSSSSLEGSAASSSSLEGSFREKGSGLVSNEPLASPTNPLGSPTNPLGSPTNRLGSPTNPLGSPTTSIPLASPSAQPLASPTTSTSAAPWIPPSASAPYSDLASPLDRAAGLVAGPLSPSAMPASNSAVPTSPTPTKRGGFNPLTRFTGRTRRSKPANSAMPTSNSAMPTSNSAMPRMTYDELAAGESASPSPADFPPSDSDSVLYHAVPAGSDDDETPLTGSPIPAELTGKSAQSKRSPRDLLPHFGETGETGETGEDETPALPADFSEEFSVRFQKLPNESENRDKSKGVSMGTRLKNAWNRILDEDGEDDKKKKKRREKKGGIPAKTAEAGNGSAGSVGNGENGAGGSAGSADLQSTGVKKGKWEIETSA